MHDEPVTRLGPQLGAELLERVGGVVRVGPVGPVGVVVRVGLGAHLDLGGVGAHGLVVGGVGRVVGELRGEVLGDLDGRLVALGLRQPQRGRTVVLGVVEPHREVGVLVGHLGVEPRVVLDLGAVVGLAVLVLEVGGRALTGLEAGSGLGLLGLVRGLLDVGEVVGGVHRELVLLVVLLRHVSLHHLNCWGGRPAR